MVDNPCYKNVDLFMYSNRLRSFWVLLEAAILSFAPSSQSTEAKTPPTSPSCGEVQAVGQAL